MNIKLKAEFNNKIKKFSLRETEVEKVIELTKDEFNKFANNLNADQDFIKDNIDLMYERDDVRHCLLVLGENVEHGILVESEGYDYARYCAFVPNVKSFLREKNMSQSLKELNDKIEDIVDYIGKILENSDETVNIDIEQLSFMFGFDLSRNKTISSTIEEMLNEKSNIVSAEFDYIENELYIKQKELEPEVILKPVKIITTRFDGIFGKIDLIQNVEKFDDLKKDYEQTQNYNDNCTVKKIIELTDEDFELFTNNLNSNNIIKEHPASQFKSIMGYHCLFVKPESRDEGVIICNERESGICYSAYTPSIEEFQGLICKQKVEQKHENGFDMTM